MEQRLKIDISFITILKIAGALLFIYLLFIIRDVLALIFVTIIIVAALSPVVESLQKKMNRTLAVTLVFAVLALLVAGVLYAIIPPLINQSEQLANNLPNYIERSAFYYHSIEEYLPTVQSSIDKMSEYLSTASKNIFSATTGIFGGIISLVTVIVLSFYLLIDEMAFKKTFYSLLPPGKIEDVSEITKKIAIKVGDWLRGQLLLGGVVALVDLIGLLIIGIPYALVIALVSGILEIVPVIGPIIAGIIAAVVALTVSPVKALIVVVLYIVVQQLENHVLVPQIMKKAVGLSPVIIIIAVITGAKLMGITGALIAIPIAGVISVVAQDWDTIKRIFS